MCRAGHRTNTDEDGKAGDVEEGWKLPPREHKAEDDAEDPGHGGTSSLPQLDCARRGRYPNHLRICKVLAIVFVVNVMLVAGNIFATHLA